MKKTYKGIDISSYNENINYDVIAKQVDFAILRAGFTGWGTHSLNVDKKFNQHYEGLRQKIPLGVYWYSCADTKERALKEAQFLLDLIADKEFSYPIYMDVEDTHNQQKLSKRELSEIVLTFTDKIESAGYYAGIYANTNWWRNELDQDLLKDVDRWVAHYGVDTPGVSGSIWQYTDKGSLPGYTGSLDLNWCSKDYPSIIKNAGLNGFPAPKAGEISVKGKVKDDAELELARRILALMQIDIKLEKM